MDEEETPVFQGDESCRRMPGETEEAFEQRWGEYRQERRRQKFEDAQRLKAEAERACGAAAQAGDDEEGIDEEDVGDPQPAPSDPLAADKAEREQHWAENRKKAAQEDELTRHWEEARVAHIDSCGGLAPLTHDLPPMDTGRFPLPRMAKPAEDRAPRYVRPDAPPDDAETELTAIIAECRYFMRGLAFESARLTPDAGDRFGFIDRACKLAETGAKVGKSVARLRSSVTGEGGA